MCRFSGKCWLGAEIFFCLILSSRNIDNKIWKRALNWESKDGFELWLLHWLVLEKSLDFSQCLFSSYKIKIICLATVARSLGLLIRPMAAFTGDLWRNVSSLMEVPLFKRQWINCHWYQTLQNVQKYPLISHSCIYS